MSNVRIILRNPLKFSDQIDYVITPLDNSLAQDWIAALQEILLQKKFLEKNFCFMGFPNNQRNLQYLCKELDQAITVINREFIDYRIQELYSAESIMDSQTYRLNHELMNQLHHHFEVLQGTVWDLSSYYRRAGYEAKYAIRQLNNLCHEIESLVLSIRKYHTQPFWTRPSQLTTFLNAKRYDLMDHHRDFFLTNGYDRVMGGVYMHWTQIGKTLFEVFRDEGAPKLDQAMCSAITELKYYSGEFDIEWGNDVVMNGSFEWHTKLQQDFHVWLQDNNFDPNNKYLSLGYLPIGQVQLQSSFGTTDYKEIWNILASHLDIYKIEVGDISDTYEYCWSDVNFKQMQIDMLKPGYDFNSR